jgi:TM2 domain-containing membrane protein YozV
MNCANHPENPVAAYCQNCGKALCTACVRSVAGVIYCEQCLAARLGIGGAAPIPGAAPGTGPVPGVVAPIGPNPGTAFALGFIPGVGAMYNGQFIKGLLHVLIFVILIGITQSYGIFGIFVAAWVAYQVFDAYQTAKARREGLPLPDPFGLNDLGSKLGIPNPTSWHGGPGVPPAQGFTSTQVPPAPPAAGGGWTPVAGFTPPAGYTDPFGQAPYTNVPPPPGGGRFRGRNEPVGAIVLIGLGVLFLLNSLDIFHFHWIWHLWPLLVIGLGVLLFVRRMRESKPPGPPPAGPQGGGL